MHFQYDTRTPLPPAIFTALYFNLLALLNSFLQLCVVDYGEDYKQTQFESSNPDTLFNTQRRQRRAANNTRVYVTGTIKAVELPREVTIGDGKDVGGFSNKKLIAGHTYRLFSRAYVKVKGTFAHKSSPLTKPVYIDIAPKATSATVVKQPGDQGGKTGASNGPAAQKGGNGVMIAGVVTGLVVFLVLVVVLVFVRRFVDYSGFYFNVLS